MGQCESAITLWGGGRDLVARGRAAWRRVAQPWRVCLQRAAGGRRDIANRDAADEQTRRADDGWMVGASVSVDEELDCAPRPSLTSGR